MYEEPNTKEEAIELWQDAHENSCCSCHISPPCGFCVNGFSLSLEEYLVTLGFDNDDME
jgi:hypothetical protein